MFKMTKGTMTSPVMTEPTSLNTSPTSPNTKRKTCRTSQPMPLKTGTTMYSTTTTATGIATSATSRNRRGDAIVSVLRPASPDATGEGGREGGGQSSLES